MANLIERAAYQIGSAVRAFREGSGGEARRPNFLTATAEAAKWRGGTFSGERDSAQRRATQNSWVYTAVNEKALEISKGALHVYRVTGLDEDAQQVPNHALEWLIRRPNPFMGGSFLWQYTQWWLDLDGNSYWFLAPDAAGNLAEIWPIPSNAVRVVPGDKERFVDYYEYQANGIIFKIPAEYICHFRYANPFDIFRGLAPLVAGMLPVDSDLAMARWNGTFFGRDNTMPSAVISLSSGNPNQPIDPADIDAVKEELRSEYAAFARKTVVTNAFDMAVQLLGYNAKDMDFLGGRQATKDEIYQIFGYPPGYADKNATEANSTVAYSKFMERIFSTLTLYSEEITAQIIHRFYNDELEARFDDIRPVNRELEIRESEAAKGDMTVNERRKRYWNLPPVDWGNKPPSPDTQFAGGEPGLMPGLFNTSNALPDMAKSDMRNWRTKAFKAMRAGRNACVPFESKLINPKLATLIQEGLECVTLPEDVKAVFDLAEKGIIRSWRPWSSFEERLADEIQAALIFQADRFIDVLRQNGDPSVLDDEQLWSEVASEMRARIQPILDQLSVSAVQRVSQTVGELKINISWDLVNERAQAWAQQHAGELIKQVTETTKQAIRDQVASWVGSSEGLDGLIERMAGLTDDQGAAVFSRRRAETIAITEATNAYAQANSQAWASAGYAPAAYRPAAHIRCRCYLQPWKTTNGKRVMVWYTARDERVCTQNLTTPWGVVKGCKDLHRRIVSEGPDLGKKADE